MFGKSIYILNLIIYLVLIPFTATFSQELVFKTKMSFKSALNDKRDILPVVSENKKSVIFFLDNFDINAIELNKDFQKTEEYSFPRPQVVYNNLLGYSILNMNIIDSET